MCCSFIFCCNYLMANIIFWYLISTKNQLVIQKAATLTEVCRLFHRSSLYDRARQNTSQKTEILDSKISRHYSAMYSSLSDDSFFALLSQFSFLSTRYSFSFVHSSPEKRTKLVSQFVSSFLHGTERALRNRFKPRDQLASNV